MTLISRKPLSMPTGRAPDRQSLTPLYSAGLCDAVNIAPGPVERPGGEVQEVGGAEPEIDDVDALLEHALGERRDELHAGRPHVPGDDHPIGRGEAGEGDPDGMGDARVELVGDDAA